MGEAPAERGGRRGVRKGQPARRATRVACEESRTQGATAVAPCANQRVNTQARLRASGKGEAGREGARRRRSGAV